MSSESKYCILKTRITPSQRTSNTAYYVWAIIEKNGERSGGNIYSAYCTCTSGLLGCCNNVTAMLFRVEVQFIHEQISHPPPVCSLVGMFILVAKQY